MRKAVILALVSAFLAGGGSLWAQGPPRGGFSTTFPWWASPLRNTLDLTDTQTKQINTIVEEYRDRLTDLYAAVNKAETELQQVFNDDPVDQRKGRQAVDQLANARGDLTRTLSAMSLEVRVVLTAQQWQDLQSHQLGRGAKGRRRGGAPITGSSPRNPTTAQKQP